MKARLVFRYEISHLSFGCIYIYIYAWPVDQVKRSIHRSSNQDGRGPADEASSKFVCIELLIIITTTQCGSKLRKYQLVT